MFRPLLVFDVLLLWGSANAAFGGKFFLLQRFCYCHIMPLYYISTFSFCMIRTWRPMTTTTEHKWRNEEDGFMCNVDYLDPVKNSPNGSPGKLDSLDLCKSRCEKNPKCQSITYFSKSKWCSHFGTPCDNKQKSKQAISWTLKRNAGLPTN